MCAPTLVLGLRRAYGNYMAKFKKSKLTEAEKARNVANGLTPTGRLRRKNLSRKGRDNAPDYPKGDYRCLGTAFTPARKNAFLDIIREEGNTAIAFREVGVSPNTVSEHRSKDHQFRDAMDEAFRQHAAIYLKEAKRRGVDGVQKPVYGSTGPGGGSGVIGWVTEYSDRLLVEMMRKYDPECRQSASKVEVTSKVEVAAQPTLDLEKLSPESRADLKRILERELERHGKVPDGQA